MLHEFITMNREEIIRRCRESVAKRIFPVPTEAEINHGVPLFRDQLVDRLSVPGTSNAEISDNAAQHGHDLLLQGFTVSQVVHDYGDVCQTITQLAMETNAPLRTEEFRLLNQCLDEAIAGAVTMFEHESKQGVSTTQDESAKRGNERIGFLVHELRNLVNTATVAFAVLKTGNVGVTGSTGAVLDCSLGGLRELIAHSLDEVRLTNSVGKRQRILVSAFIAEVEEAARLAANACSITLLVPPIAKDLAIDADGQVLAAVIRQSATERLQVHARQQHGHFAGCRQRRARPHRGSGRMRWPYHRAYRQGRRRAARPGSQRPWHRTRVLPMGRRSQRWPALFAQPS